MCDTDWKMHPINGSCIALSCFTVRQPCHHSSSKSSKSPSRPRYLMNYTQDYIGYDHHHHQQNVVVCVSMVDNHRIVPPLEGALKVRRASWEYKPICLRMLVNSSLLHGAQSFTCQESCWGAEIRTRAVGSRTALSSTYVHFAHLAPLSDSWGRKYKRNCGAPGGRVLAWTVNRVA